MKFTTWFFSFTFLLCQLEHFTLFFLIHISTGDSLFASDIKSHQAIIKSPNITGHLTGRISAWMIIGGTQLTLL